MKTNKSFSKRIKITKTGKLISRKPGQNHFNAKESGRSLLAKGRSQSFKIGNKAKSLFISTAGKAK